MKRFLILLALGIATVGAYAQRITEQEAMKRALQYMKGSKSSAVAKRMTAPAKGGGAKLTPVSVETNCVYAFNCEGGGFIIASGDSRTDFVDGNVQDAEGNTRLERVAVAPLVKTHWNQMAPYWDQCPKYNGANPVCSRRH